ncbi:hypothetical protein [Humisphaera borealis]|uniref:Uncharacterized protein n=1 Tax=Humisphaera borealis TaxID=2807512 RepID=A0A7M2WX94_9BACT|nr:hypothetical protein [Humisphaera borealis]QOV89974.1 hypothetical protein IPV69_00960 [Humisphaera borealis]
MSPADTASLIIATFDLGVVRSIRGAMLAADIASGRGQPASGLGPAPNPRFEDRRHFHPGPRYEPRPHIHPTPKYEPRTIHYTVRYEVGLEQQHNACTAVVPSVEVDSVAKVAGVPAVWKSLPPVEHDEPIRRPIKVIRHHPDIRHRGIVIDVHA